VTKFIALAMFTLGLATSAQAMPVASLPPVDEIVSQAALGCGPGRTRVGGVCIARTTKRQARRCAVWGAGNVCRRWN
jgi:hypothetical protein